MALAGFMAENGPEWAPLAPNRILSVYSSHV